MNRSSLENCLDNFFKRFVNETYARTSRQPVTLYEPDWPSRCQQGEIFLSEQMESSIYWLPQLRDDNNDLSGIEAALETPVHPDLKVFFTRYWSEQLETHFDNGNLTLMFLWNAEDVNRLIKNQLGHALNKLRNRQPLTFFIACTDSEYIISLENDTGKILVERPGYPPDKVLADNLYDFIEALEYGHLS
jgi:SecY interacting protein Syd